jgi:hypothetical protein
MSASKPVDYLWQWFLQAQKNYSHPFAKENTAQEHPSAEPPIPVEGSEERRNNICKAARGIHATAAAERSHQLGLAQSGSVSTVSGNNGFSIRKIGSLGSC